MARYPLLVVVAAAVWTWRTAGRPVLVLNSTVMGDELAKLLLIQQPVWAEVGDDLADELGVGQVRP